MILFIKKPKNFRKLSIYGKGIHLAIEAEGSDKLRFYLTDPKNIKGRISYTHDLNLEEQRIAKEIVTYFKEINLDPEEWYKLGVDSNSLDDFKAELKIKRCLKLNQLNQAEGN